MRVNGGNIAIFGAFLVLWIIAGYAIEGLISPIVWFFISFAAGMVVQLLFPWFRYE